MLEVRILGCGSSGGVPRPGEGGPNWGACDPANPKNRRLRCSILVTRRGTEGETRILVDTSPDMREQLLAAKIGKLDGVLITHDHADQLHGLDDLRVVTMNMKRRLDLWSDHYGLAGVRKKFGYCFEAPAGSDYPPILNAHEIPEPFADFDISEMSEAEVEQELEPYRSIKLRDIGSFKPPVVNLNQMKSGARVTRDRRLGTPRPESERER